MKKILFVCTGNTCRSPMAEAIFNDKAKKRNADFRADSAGLSAFEGAGVSSYADKALSMIGIDVSGHSATLFDPKEASKYDVICGMTPSHAHMIAKIAPSLSGKVCVLGDGIPDPFGMDLDEYIICRDAITAGIDRLWEELQHER